MDLLSQLTYFPAITFMLPWRSPSRAPIQNVKEILSFLSPCQQPSFFYVFNILPLSWKYEHDSRFTSALRDSFSNSLKRGNVFFSEKALLQCKKSLFVSIINHNSLNGKKPRKELTEISRSVKDIEI